MNFISSIRKNLVNIPGWRTKRKLLVIESDDWGSIAMPSIEIYNRLKKSGIPVEVSPFSNTDTLESEEDLQALFDCLGEFKDFRGNHPCITADTIVANPDFEKIKNTKYEEFHFEPFPETYKKYPGRENAIDVWKSEGLSKKMLWPQLHGREHLNPIEWLRVLKTGNEQEILLFENNTLFASSLHLESKRKMGYLAAFDYDSIEELKSFEKVIDDAANIFESIFGFKSTSFVAPTSVRSDKIDNYLFNNGIRFHQLGQQILPYKEGYKKKDRFWGETNKLGQVYWRRNSRFEPSLKSNFPWVETVIKDIELAFRWGKPAVISSHRVNFVAGLKPKNRDMTLTCLKSLLSKVLEKYPDIEFISSDQLGNSILETKK